MIPNFFKTIRNFLLDYLPKQRCLSVNTIISYRYTLNLIIKFLNKHKNFSYSDLSFSIFKSELIVEFLDWLETERNNSISSRNQRLLGLRSFFKYAGTIESSNFVLYLDSLKIPLKKSASRIVDFLSEDTLKILFQQPDLKTNSGIRNQFFMILMYDTAARCGELLNMRVGDLRLDTKTATAYLFGKGSKPRIVPLLDKTVEHCKRYINIFHEPKNDNEFLFFTKSHGVRNQLSPDAVAAFMKKYGESARLSCKSVPNRVHPHQLRHSRAIHLYRGGMPLSLVSELLGHSSVETTKIYAYAD